MRPVVAVLLLAGCTLAQTKPDFSGIFLRTETTEGKHSEPAVPRIIEVKQTANEIAVTAAQNGETAVVRYRLDSKKSDRVYARLKAKSLVLKGTIAHRSDPEGFGFGFPSIENLEKTWELSPDGQRLLIRTKGNVGISDVDTYIRQPSMDAALAASSTVRRGCDGSSRVSGLTRKTHARGKYEEGASLGVAYFERLTSSVLYDAVMSGKFFKDLEWIADGEHGRFHKNGQPVTNYTGDIVLGVAPHPHFFSDELGAWEPIGPEPPNATVNLRFMVRWLGAEQRDLGEVEPEFLYEPWRELLTPTAFYRMRIPAQDVPLTDDLEVLIFSRTGEQLACVKGHI
jgi:hypothetical protein